jgi:hypothetical protein
MPPKSRTRKPTAAETPEPVKQTEQPAQPARSWEYQARQLLEDAAYFLADSSPANRARMADYITKFLAEGK